MARSFEESLKELEKVVQTLEDGDLPLEQSLKLFENGVKLARDCKDRLTQAQRRIEVLMKEADGTFSVRELDDSFSEDDDD